MIKTVDTVELNGKRYYRPLDFAHATGKSENTVYRLINHGNAIRRLKCTYEYMAMPLIPEEELTAFPFTGSGRYAAKEVYHYNEAGIAVPCYVCSMDGVGKCANTREDRS